MLPPQVWSESGPRSVLGTVSSVLSRASLLVGGRSGDIRVERLSGALTNASYKVTTDGGVYVLRLAGAGTSEYVDRVSEEHNARIAAGVGVNAEVLYFDARDGTMLTRFVEGRSMDEGGGWAGSEGRSSGRRWLYGGSTVRVAPSSPASTPSLRWIATSSS